MKLSKNRKGETESVFKLALVVIIIAAVLAVVAYLMQTAWTSTGQVATGAATAGESVETSTDCLVAGNCDDAAPGP
jgi:flagellar basal body-associated protein FliL